MGNKKKPEPTPAPEVTEGNASPAVPKRNPSGWYAVLTIGFTALLFMIFKAYSTTPVAGDENIYLYAGWRAGQGVFPYRDIFMAHPPMHMVVATIWMLPGWLGPWWGKLASVIPALMTIIGVQLLLRMVGAPLLTILVSGLLLVFSYDMLTISSHFTGSSWSMLMLVLGIGSIATRRRFTGGVLLAFAGLTTYHIVPAVFGVVLGDLIGARKKAIKTVVTVGGVTAGVHLLCWALFGQNYIDQVFGYHLAKSAMGEMGSTLVIRFFHSDYTLAVLGSLGAALWMVGVSGEWHGREPVVPTHGLFGLVTISAISQAAGVLTADRVFTYYLAPLLPLFAIDAALVFWLIQKRTWEIVANRQFGWLKSNLAWIILSLLLVAFGFSFGEKMEAGIGYYKRDYGLSFTYDWRDSPILPGVVNAMVEALAFRSERRVGDIDMGLTRYFWHEISTENPSKLLPYLESYADKPGTIFGDASTVPYFALATDRTIALEQADTNAQLFKSGVLEPDSFFARLEERPPRLIVLNPRRGITYLPQMRKYVEVYYDEVAKQEIKRGKYLVLYERKANPGR